MKKTQISEIQRNLLLILAKAGRKNLPSIKAAVGIQDDPGFEKQVAELRQLGLVEDSVEAGSGLPALTLTEIGRRLLMR